MLTYHLSNQSKYGLQRCYNCQALELLNNVRFTVLVIYIYNVNIDVAILKGMDKTATSNYLNYIFILFIKSYCQPCRQGQYNMEPNWFLKEIV